MPTTNTRTIEVNSSGARLAVRDHPGEGTPVVLLHGGPGVPDYLGPVAEMLAPPHRAITFDQRGVGASECLNDRYGVEDHLSDVEAIRNHLGIERWHVFGHSWGGLLAQLYAYAHPERVESLFLCNPGLGIGEGWMKNQREVARYNLRQSGVLGSVALIFWYLASYFPGGVGELGSRNASRWAWRNFFLDPREAPPPDEGWVRGVSATATHKTEKALFGADPGMLPEVWEDPGFAVLVLFGSYDIFSNGVELVRRRFPTARQVLIEDAGHLPWVQNREPFLEVLKSFYEDAENSSERRQQGEEE